jgi:FAD/FMN-containing dehydrogenase
MLSVGRHQFLDTNGLHLFWKLGPSPENGLAVSMEHFKQFRYDSGSQTVTVGTGWRVANLIEKMASEHQVSFVHLRTCVSTFLAELNVTNSILQHRLDPSLLAARFLRKKNIVFATQPFVYHFCLSGAHGSSLRHVSTLSDQIVGLEVIHPDGSINTITDSERLNHYRVAMGSLGIITTVTFSVVPLFKVNWSTSQHSEDILTDGRTMLMNFLHESC